MVSVKRLKIINILPSIDRYASVKKNAFLLVTYFFNKVNSNNEVPIQDSTFNIKLNLYIV